MSLEKMKKMAEIKKVEAAIAELEYKIEERKIDIQRMIDHIELQLKRKTEIEKEITDGGL
jgi:hypothetical protein